MSVASLSIGHLKKTHNFSKMSMPVTYPGVADIFDNVVRDMPVFFEISA